MGGNDTNDIIDKSPLLYRLFIESSAATISALTVGK